MKKLLLILSIVLSIILSSCVDSKNIITNTADNTTNSEVISTVTFGTGYASVEEINSVSELINNVLFLKKKDIASINLRTSIHDDNLHIITNTDDINSILNLLASYIDLKNITNDKTPIINGSVFGVSQIFLQSADGELVLDFLINSDGIWAGNNMNIYLGNKITNTDFQKEFKQYLK